jgi:hypothetical protein
MPLAHGYTRHTIGRNIKVLRREGKKLSQAIAIALSEARRSAKKRGKRPHALFGTASAKRHLKKRSTRHARRR